MQSGVDEERKEQAEKREERGAEDSERRSDASARLETLVSANAKVGLSNQEGVKIVPSEQGRKGASDLEQEEKEIREEVGATARVLRFDDVKKIWHPPKELRTRFK